MSMLENLDFYCVDYAQRVIGNLKVKAPPLKLTGDEVAHQVSKLLNVLYNNGLYACLLYLSWKVMEGTPKEKTVASLLESQLIGRRGEPTLLRLEPIALPIKEAGDSLEAGRLLSQDLDDLFLARDLLARTLMYVRYHAKTMA